MIEIKGKHCKDLKIFTDNIEETALSTLYKVADEVPYENTKIRIMPDVHQGVGNTVIGFSCPIDLENGYVSVQAVGCDLGCSVSAWFYDNPIPSDKIAEFEHKIRKDIPFGFNINQKSKVDVKYLIKEVNKTIHRIVSMHPILSEHSIEFKSEVDVERWCSRIGIDYGVFLKSIGTVGGGETIATV